MRIVFVGVGALGSYFGGALAAAGHDVTLVIRNESHRFAILANGLRLVLDSGEQLVHPRVVAPKADAQRLAKSPVVTGDVRLQDRDGRAQHQKISTGAAQVHSQLKTAQSQGAPLGGRLPLRGRGPLPAVVLRGLGPGSGHWDGTHQVLQLGVALV